MFNNIIYLMSHYAPFVHITEVYDFSFAKVVPKTVVKLEVGYDMGYLSITIKNKKDYIQIPKERFDDIGKTLPFCCNKNLEDVDKEKIYNVDDYTYKVSI